MTYIARHVEFVISSFYAREIPFRLNLQNISSLLVVSNVYFVSCVEFINDIAIAKVLLFFTSEFFNVM